jgi:ABC-2 type transport system ATP-binding protein
LLTKRQNENFAAAKIKVAAEMSRDRNPLLKASGLKRSFGSLKAVDGVDIEIQAGEFIALLGPNGAGKTTLVEMIEGIQQADAGSVEIAGMSWQGNRRRLQNLLGISLQETHFINKLTVSETLALFASFYRLERQRIDIVLALVNLREKAASRVENLSGGQRQRLALGIALLNEPPLLLLDEPTTGLDPSARREIWQILLALKKEHNTALLLTTHYMEEAEYLCDRIIIMDRGRVLASGTLNELLARQQSHVVFELELATPLNDEKVLQHDAVKQLEVRQNRSQWRLEVKDNLHYVAHLQKLHDSRIIELLGFTSRKMTLDDLFIAMTGKHLSEEDNI